MTEFLTLMLDPFVHGGGACGTTPTPFAPERTDSLPPNVALAYASLMKAPPTLGPFDRKWTLWGGSFGGGVRLDGNATVTSAICVLRRS